MEGFLSRWKCKHCGCAFDDNISIQEYNNSFYGQYTSSWDPEIMPKSEISTFQFSYVIDDDRYQTIYYSPQKITLKKSWGGLNPNKSVVEDAPDWHESIEFNITEKEDAELHAFLKKIDFELWEPCVESLLAYLEGACGCHGIPGFSCTFKNNPYIFFTEFSRSNILWKYDEDPCYVVSKDYEKQVQIVNFLQHICKNHSFDLPGIFL